MCHTIPSALYTRALETLTKFIQTIRYLFIYYELSLWIIHQFPLIKRSEQFWYELIEKTDNQLILLPSLFKW